MGQNKNFKVKFLIGLFFLFAVQLAQGQVPEGEIITEPGVANAAPSCTLEIRIEGAIGPANLDFIDRAIAQAERLNCASILALINTPGGSLQTTRYIVERILNSEKPFLCLIYPNGAHAGSAGAIIMQACHVAGAMEATNIGAATPVTGGGQEMGEDMRNKIVNDTRSWVEGIAKLRGRSTQFAKDIVDLAKAVTAAEAKKLNAIEWVGSKKSDFLEFSAGRKVKMSENKTVEVVVGEELTSLPLDFRYKVLDFITHPQFAYLIFMGSLGLLYFELTHPGAIVPGVIGALGLVISLMSMHMLDISVAGLILIFLGVVLMIAEAFITSFGMLGLGGVIAFFLGSLFLYDPSFSGYSLPMATILPTTIILGLLMIGVAYLALSTRKRKQTTSKGGMIGLMGVVTLVGDDQKSGQIEVHGELWNFQSKQTVKLNDKVGVVGARGLTLDVEVITKE